MFALGGLALYWLECEYLYGYLDIRNRDLILRLNVKWCLDDQSEKLQLCATTIIILIYTCVKKKGFQNGRPSGQTAAGGDWLRRAGYCPSLLGRKEEGGRGGSAEGGANGNGTGLPNV
jgi:hypothetical protein